MVSAGYQTVSASMNNGTTLVLAKLWNSSEKGLLMFIPNS